LSIARRLAGLRCGVVAGRRRSDHGLTDLSGSAICGCAKPCPPCQFVRVFRGSALPACCGNVKTEMAQAFRWSVVARSRIRWERPRYWSPHDVFW